MNSSSDPISVILETRYERISMSLTATETVAIGSAKITVLPDSLESFVAHYSEDTAFLNPSEKTRFLDIYMTGTNCTAAASEVISTVCQAFTAVATTAGKKEEE